MFFVDLDKGRIIPDSEIKTGLASAVPWREWLEKGIVSLSDPPSREHIDHSRSSVLRRLQEFGYTQEDLDVILAPMAASGAAVHHHLLRRQTRTLVGLIVEAGDVREVHHVATLIGYGASAVTPYLAMEAAEELARTGRLGSTSADEAVAHLIKALGKGVLKVMSKMGISTVSSYCGAQVFQAIGLDEDFVARYFTGTPSPLGGIGIDVIAREVAERHAIAYPPSGISPAHRALDVGGEYRWRREGEEHLFTPENIARLQTATRTASREIFREYTRGVDDQSERLMTLRGLMRLRTDEVEPVPLEEVEPVSEIVKRFATGAMSFGSISREAHETMAIAMNTLGARSNSGEGGEAPERLRDPLRNSAIKQVASGRFGVTADYLSHARDIQIKMAQGAKPGEGGQLPAAKVYPWVAQERHSTPPASDSSHRRRTMTSTRSKTSNSSSPTSRTPTPRPACTSSSSPKSGSERSLRAYRKPGQTSSSSREPTAEPAPPLSPPSSTRARPGSSTSPKRSRPSSWAICATGSSFRPTGSSRPGAMSSSPPCSAPRSSVSRPPRSSSPAAS